MSSLILILSGEDQTAHFSEKKPDIDIKSFAHSQAIAVSESGINSCRVASISSYIPLNCYMRQEFISDFQGFVVVVKNLLLLKLGSFDIIVKLPYSNY